MTPIPYGSPYGFDESAEDRQLTKGSIASYPAEVYTAGMAVETLAEAPAEPSAGSGNGAAVESSRVECLGCGHAGEPVGRGQCSACGRFLPHNEAGLVHGGRRDRPLMDPEDAPLFQEWAADLGGVEELSTAARVLLRRAAEADAVCQSALDYVLNSRESLTAARVQRALDTLHKHTGTMLACARLLGVNQAPREVYQ